MTGASSGIGIATASALADQGADVAINYLTYPEAASDVCSQIKAKGKKAKLYQVDVSDYEKVDAMTRDIVKDFGRIDLLVTCAVYSDREAFYNCDLDGFRKTIDVTMWGAFNALRAVTNRLIEQGEGGSIVLIGSPHAVVPTANCMAYNMAKAAVDHMAKTAACELVDHNIRVNIVRPGWTDTLGERKFFNEEQLKEGARGIPAGRLAHPDEIARGVLFMLADESEYINGSTLAIDGGVSLPWVDKRF